VPRVRACHTGNTPYMSWCIQMLRRQHTNARSLMFLILLCAHSCVCNVRSVQAVRWFGSVSSMLSACEDRGFGARLSPVHAVEIWPAHWGSPACTLVVDLLAVCGQIVLIFRPCAVGIFMIAQGRVSQDCDWGLFASSFAPRL
jgi:hypothetical protein